MTIKGGGGGGGGRTESVTLKSERKNLNLNHFQIFFERIFVFVNLQNVNF